MTISASPPVEILLLGHDKSLIETRKWILEKAGYRLETAMPFTASPMLPEALCVPSPSLVLLCDSLSSETRHAILQAAPERWPKSKLIVITPSRYDLEPETPAIVIPGCEGPGKLVALIQQMLPHHLYASSASAIQDRQLQ